jgi:chromosome partitioning protein
MSATHAKLEPGNNALLEEPFVASMRDVGAMAPLAQLVGKAIFDLDQSDTEQASSDGDYYRGAVWADWQKRMEEYKQEIGRLASILE